MTKKTKDNTLSIKHELFCFEYVRNWWNGKQAYEKVYWTTWQTAEVNSSKLLSKTKVSEKVNELRKELRQSAEEKNFDVHWTLIELTQRCMQAVPVMVYDKELKEYVHATDEGWNHLWTFDSSWANSALDKLAKIQGEYEKDNKQKAEWFDAVLSAIRWASEPN